jgi:uncharacterized membrane protein HdeD (DUF308 family)
MEGEQMIGTLARNWGYVALRGAAALIFGVLAIIFPGETVTTLVVLFAIFAIVDGFIAIVDAVTIGRVIDRTGLFLVVGLFSLVIGIVTLLVPNITLLALVYLIAARAVLGGINEIVQAVRLRDEISYEWLLGIAGAVSILFGFIVALAPLRSLAFFVIFIGVYAIFIGVSQLARAWDMRAHLAKGK